MAQQLEEGAISAASDTVGIELGINTPRLRSETSVTEINAFENSIVTAVLPLHVKKKDLGRWAELRQEFSIAINSFKGLINLAYVDPDDSMLNKAKDDDTVLLSVVIKFDSY